MSTELGVSVIPGLTDSTLTIRTCTPLLPTLRLTVNGENPPNKIVVTPETAVLTLDMIPCTTDPVILFLALTAGDVQVWITSTGVSPTPAPVAVLNSPFFGLKLLEYVQPAGQAITWQVFLLATETNGLIGMDSMTVRRS